MQQAQEPDTLINAKISRAFIPPCSYLIRTNCLLVKILLVACFSRTSHLKIYFQIGTLEAIVEIIVVSKLSVTFL